MIVKLISKVIYMKHVENMQSAINLVSLMGKNACIRTIMIDEQNPEKFMLGVSTPSNTFHLVEHWGDNARQMGEVKFFSDSFAKLDSRLKPIMDVVSNDDRIPTFTELYSVVTEAMMQTGINPAECINKGIYSESLSVGYSKDGWDHDTEIDKGEFFKTYPVTEPNVFETNE